MKSALGEQPRATRLLCLALLVPEACMTSDDPKSTQPDPEALSAPPFVLEAFPEYLIGFAMAEQEFEKPPKSYPYQP